MKNITSIYLKSSQLTFVTRNTVPKKSLRLFIFIKQYKIPFLRALVKQSRAMLRQKYVLDCVTSFAKTAGLDAFLKMAKVQFYSLLVMHCFCNKIEAIDI